MQEPSLHSILYPLMLLHWWPFFSILLGSSPVLFELCLQQDSSRYWRSISTFDVLWILICSKLGFFPHFLVSSCFWPPFFANFIFYVRSFFPRLVTVQQYWEAVSSENGIFRILDNCEIPPWPSWKGKPKKNIFGLNQH